LKSINDPDTGDITSVLDVYDSATKERPTFITSFDKNSITINPTEYIQVKTYTMIVIITDTYDTT
jgi:hypothetical protein